jgi:adenylate cyclase
LATAGLAAAALCAIVVAAYLAFRPASWPLGSTAPAGLGPSVPTIAVMPFANLSGDPRREYFSDGVAEDVIGALGRFAGVRVLSIGAVQGFKGRAAAPREVRAALGARYVVQGSVREENRRVRVTVSLSDGETGTQLWSERHDAEGPELFEIQDRIAHGIAGALHVKLSEIEQQRGVSRPVTSLEAHDLVLRARELINRTSRSANREAREHLARAAQLSPEYAEVHTELGRAEFQRLTNGWVEDAAWSLAQVESLARKALASPDTRTHARAHSLLAALYSHQDRYQEALSHADKAIELNPSESMALYWRGNALMVSARLDEAIAVLETARRFEPHPAAGQGVNLAIAYYLARRYPEALAQADALLVHATQQPYLRAVRAATLAQMGRLDEARSEADRVLRVNPLFDPEQFGSYLGDGPYKVSMREGLRKAGL